MNISPLIPLLPERTTARSSVAAVTRWQPTSQNWVTWYRPAQPWRENLTNWLSWGWLWPTCAPSEVSRGEWWLLTGLEVHLRWLFWIAEREVLTLGWVNFCSASYQFFNITILKYTYTSHTADRCHTRKAKWLTVEMKLAVTLVILGSSEL